MDQDAEVLPARDDTVDRMQREWARLRPDLNFSSLGVIHRLLRASRLILEASDAFLADYGLTRGELDVLSALRRTDEPLNPTTLAQTLLVPRSAITMRLNSLQARGLLSRTANPADGRSSLLILTDTGAALVDEVIPAQLALEDALLAEAPAWVVEGLVDPLRALTSVWEQERGRQTGPTKGRRNGTLEPSG
ncbi:MarR family transcriptional regulator [Arthrobacter sp. FW306-05-C]|uniref:MarR family winged helix-turn-helix transcriptional regulator n=1 Tax=unclassified Arthrobacter TaxID=235627 RepID=UPI001EF03EE9|nr:MULTISPECIES: MarR family transcriptional regulator [unclassified Arthrobacter]UKA68475.1 MarR family transcriptional regulator [Arthrobacter sp. FW306-05-C]UKA77167.1 MarR family transcriptional regulator [Arthrobacter sp. FW306-07-I]